jgi:hypothetical protein
MASRETMPPQENREPQSEHRPIRSQLSKYVGDTPRAPRDAQWARELMDRVPDIHKPLITEFIKEINYEDRQRAAEHLVELMRNRMDEIANSFHKEVEIGQCMDDTLKWLEEQKKKEREQRSS